MRLSAILSGLRMDSIKKPSKATCYMCDSEATTVEHAPPKCIFPQKKDTSNGIDYRNGLITVPSCDEHNTAKSKDDEYLLYVISASITSNNVGLNQFLTKVKRSAERKPALASKITANSAPVRIFHEDKQQWEDAFGLVIQGERIDSAIEKCARALYFYETNTKFLGGVKVITPFTIYSDTSLSSSTATAIEVAERHFALHLVCGGNPDVFSYKFDEGENSAIMLFYFYGETKVLVRLDKLKEN
jgi:hypothetical protein